MHTSYLLLISLTITIFGMTQSRQKSKLCAPTHCIATDADFKGSANEMRVRGTSNLPPGTRLGVDVYDSIGRGSTQFNEDAVTTVNRNGFFEVVLRPKAGLAFRHNLVCNVVFMPTYPRQERSVLDVTGKRGEHLGFPENPQARVASGGYYLSETIYVP